MLDRDKQIALIEEAEARHAEYERVWVADAEFMAALHRYDHEFDEAPPPRVAVG